MSTPAYSVSAIPPWYDVAGLRTLHALEAGPEAVLNTLKVPVKLEGQASRAAWSILGQPVERVAFALVGLLLVIIGLTQLRSVKTVVAVARSGAKKAVEAAGTIGVAA